MSGITNPAEKYFKDGLWTFDGSVWRPQNQLLSYRDVFRAAYYNGDAAAGDVIWNNTTVPAGEAHILTSVVGYNAITAAAYLYFQIVSATVGHNLAFSGYKPLTRYQEWQGQCVMKAGENIRVIFSGTILHDILYAQVIGHKFMIAE